MKPFACSSVAELAEVQDITVVSGGALSGVVDGDKRREVIKAVRAGEHAELHVRARTFRQKDGAPNKNYLRIATDKLPAVAASFIGKPMLRDHEQHNSTARIGTIVESKAVAAPDDWTEFHQVLHVVEPQAVIGVLTGLVDRFSIGWHRLGAVQCTAHKSDVTRRGSCGCWPGDRVEVDGKEHVVEFEFQNAEGVEVSTVNAPAVQGTGIEAVRAALSAELGLERGLERGRGVALALAHGDDDFDYDEALACVADQLGLKYEDVQAEARRMSFEKRRKLGQASNLEIVAYQLGHRVEDLEAMYAELYGE